MDLIAHRIRTGTELAGNLLVTDAAGNQLEDLHFTGGELIPVQACVGLLGGRKVVGNV